MEIFRGVDRNIIKATAIRSLVVSARSKENSLSMGKLLL